MLLASIRFKIVLWHMLILSLALFVFGMVLYHNLSLKIADGTDDVLRSRAKGIEQSIDTYWEAERLQIAEGDLKVRFTKADNINFIRIAKRWVGENGSASYLVQQLPTGGVRAWRITNEVGIKTLFARLLPFTSSLANPLSNQSLVYQTGWGGYLSVYQWQRD